MNDILTRDEKLEEEATQNWYFTFGQNHVHANKYVKIVGTFHSARELMFKKFGKKWAFQYPESLLEASILKYGCTELQC